MSELTMELLAGMYKNAVVRIATLEREILRRDAELFTLRKVVAAYNTSGCADADAMAIAYLEAREKIGELEESLRTAAVTLQRP